MGVKRKKTKAVDVCAYLGPTIQGIIQHGTIYKGTKKKVVASLESVVEKYPLIESLIISGKDLPKARIKVKTKGNLLNVNYEKLVSNSK